MTANVPAAPKFSRRVHSVDELQQAIVEAVRATGAAASDISFDAVVRLEVADAGSAEQLFTLTILKRN